MAAADINTAFRKIEEPLRSADRDTRLGITATVENEVGILEASSSAATEADTNAESQVAAAAAAAAAVGNCIEECWLLLCDGRLAESKERMLDSGIC